MAIWVKTINAFGETETMVGSFGVMAASEGKARLFALSVTGVTLIDDVRSKNLVAFVYSLLKVGQLSNGHAVIASNNQRLEGFGSDFMPGSSSCFEVSHPEIPNKPGDHTQEIVDIVTNKGQRRLPKCLL